MTRTLHYDGAKKFKHIDISEGYFDADIILSLPKFKTHGITYITGAVKLLFGAIPGVEKSKMHMRAPTPEEFSEFILDLYGAMTNGFSPPKPIIHIMDAICAQEGEGPGPAGKPKWLNAVLAGDNGIAVDYVAARVAGVDIKKALTVVNGFKRGYGVSSADEIEVVGETIDSMRAAEFEPATGASFFSNMFRWPFNTPTFKNLFLDRPVPQEEKCTLCYQCKKICASGAISESDGRKKVPSYDYNTCIRCYCCLEVCPEAAIRKEKGRLQWMMGG
jgi:Pyruvate/2-oxoacid:ferredoxin oxidoreductase delta subunit